MNRQDFPILKKTIKGQPLVYFDNAATSQKPLVVITAISDFYLKYNANVHRALNPLAEEATRRYEAARTTIAAFVSARPEEVIFTRGATESINLVARSWGEENLKRGDIVVLTRAEHHSNIVPWLQLKDKLGIGIRYIPLRTDGRLDMVAAKKILAEKRVKLLAFTHVSNVLGLINPAAQLAALARRRGIVTLLDASQSAAHLPLSVRRLGCDFLVFSGHKLGGPTGIGILYGRREILEKMPPFLGGGDMIREVHADSFSLNDLPYKLEAGTPPIAGAIGLAAACEYISAMAWSRLIREEKKLTAFFLKKISSYGFIKLIGSGSQKLPIFSLIVDGVPAHDAADLLGEEGIILRAGYHCAQPLHEYLAQGASLRASLSFYNTTGEISTFIRKLLALRQAFRK